jgi:hypothetical protein
MRVFISYRREDASGHAGRLYDSLARRFGPDNVFMDVDTIGLGSAFADVIGAAVMKCDILVALGDDRGDASKALVADDGNGDRRRDDPSRA